MSDCNNCNQTDRSEVCFTPTDTTIAPVTLIQQTILGVDGDGNPSNVYYLSTADDLNTALDPTAYLGGGTYSAGACPVAQPDVEWIELCEKLADGTNKPFIRRSVTTFDALNVPSTVGADFELDKVTPYTVVDSAQVGECGCEPLANTGLVTDIALFK